jgi:hypothetical protein
MRSKDSKILVSALFLFIFLVKMGISLAPLFSNIDSKTAAAVIMQLEHETKSDKDDLTKDTIKEKNVFDDYLLISFEHQHYIIEQKVLFNLEKSLYIQSYHPTIPTPPPNA